MLDFSDVLTIVIPTYNHPNMIKYILDNYRFIDEYNIQVSIHDSSPNDEIEKLIKEYNYKCFSYFKYDSSLNVDVKTIMSLAQVKTKYAYLCGDGVVLNKEMLDNLYNQLIKDYDLIELYDTDLKRHIDYFNKISKGKETIIYNDIRQHFVDNFWHMPFYGGSIVKKEVFTTINIEKIANEPYNGFIYPYFIYKYFADKNFCGVVIGGNYFHTNIYKSGSSWIKNKQLCEVWIDNFDSCVNSLPSIYDDYKKEVIHNTGVNTTFFSFTTLCKFKGSGNFNYKLYKKYKEKIYERTNSSKFSIWLAAIVPNFIFKILRKIKKSL